MVFMILFIVLIRILILLMFSNVLFLYIGVCIIVDMFLFWELIVGGVIYSFFFLMVVVNYGCLVVK